MDPPSAIQTIVAGIGFTEGPLWTSDQQLWVTGTSRGCLYSIDVDRKSVQIVCETGGSPTGLAQDADGMVWVAQGGRAPRGEGRPASPSIQYWNDDTLVTAKDGFCAPNDCAIGPDGRLWFTDPAGPALRGDAQPGSVRILDRKTGIIETFVDDVLYPNGLAFAPSGDALFVAETRTGRILRYALGRPRPKSEVFGEVSRGHPDGLAIDRDGDLYVATFGAQSIDWFGPDGRLKGCIELDDGQSPTNLCFGGIDLSTLYVTVPSGGRVIAIDRDIPGLRLLQGPA